MKATTTDPPPPRCGHCRADSMGCSVKLGLGGRRCCEMCSHGVCPPKSTGAHDG